MADMPRPRKPFVQKEVTRHGRTVWYFRRGKEKRIRLPGTFGSKEFNDAYNAALMGQEVVQAPRSSPMSTRWLVDHYYSSARFQKLRPNTQRNQRLLLESVCKTGGDIQIRYVTAKHIRVGLVNREATPRMAATYVTTMRRLFAFAIDSGWISNNPVDGIKAAPSKTVGYHTWTEEEIAQYQAKHKVGTQARLALDIMLYTGLRRGDAIRLGKQHIKGNVIRIRADKNGADIEIPLLKPLADSIKATPTGDLVFLLNTRKRPWKNLAFGYWFAARCGEAHVPGRAHGLRKAAATICANNGATSYELTAMFGWSSTQMAEVYTKKADRARLAERAANRLSPHQPEGAGVEPLDPKDIKAANDRR